MNPSDAARSNAQVSSAHGLPSVSRGFSQPMAYSPDKNHRRRQTVHTIQLTQQPGNDQVQQAYTFSLDAVRQQQAQQQKLAYQNQFLNKNTPIVGPIMLPGPYQAPNPSYYRSAWATNSTPLPAIEVAQQAIQMQQTFAQPNYTQGLPTFPTSLQPPVAAMQQSKQQSMQPSHVPLPSIKHPGKSAVSTLCNAVDDLNVNHDAALLLGLHDAQCSSPTPSEVMEECTGEVRTQQWDVRARYHSMPVSLQTYRTPPRQFSSLRVGSDPAYMTEWTGREGNFVLPAASYSQSQPIYFDPHFRTNTSSTLGSVDSTLLDSPIGTLSSVQLGTMRRHPSDESSDWNRDTHSDDDVKQKRGREAKGTIEWRESESGRIKVWKCSVCKKEFATSAYLSRHARIHSSSRPYACQIPGCVARFKRSDHARAHERSHEKKLQAVPPNAHPQLPDPMSSDLQL